MFLYPLSVALTNELFGVWVPLLHRMSVSVVITAIPDLVQNGLGRQDYKSC